MWVRNSDHQIFNDDEDAYQDYLMEEDLTYLEDTLVCEELLPYDVLLHWAMTTDAFWEYFQDAISAARERCFEELYHEVEPDELELYFEDDQEALEKLGIIPTE